MPPVVLKRLESTYNEKGLEPFIYENIPIITDNNVDRIITFFNCSNLSGESKNLDNKKYNKTMLINFLEKFAATIISTELEIKKIFKSAQPIIHLSRVLTGRGLYLRIIMPRIKINRGTGKISLNRESCFIEPGR